MTGQELLDFLLSCSPEQLAGELKVDYEGFHPVRVDVEQDGPEGQWSVWLYQL